VSVEDTFADDVEDPGRLRAELEGLVARVTRRLRAGGRAGRTVTLKVRRADFTLLARSDTLLAPTDDYGVIVEVATRLLSGVDVRGGIRLLGVGVSGLADAVQGELFESNGEEASPVRPAAEAVRPVAWLPGADVVHTRWGAGWVEAHHGEEVRVRFETETSDPGPVRQVAIDDPELRAVAPD
jgi:DNA polymerase-4